jgi:hypothetical protein
MNFLAGIISTILGLIIGAVLGFFLLIALNGFSGKAADYAIYTYIGWVIIFSLIIGAISFFGTGLLVKKSFNTILSVIIPIIVSIVLSFGGNFLGMIISAIVAQEMWKK